ncbi:Mitochondrial-processing peptidase subunit beta [Tritrichomonas musculus]|uniref:Mitochondrial-processing peptidase subunit beta n=1 Tax=Tritrichomonas musculus TaxID=1915356 RepID=A0ABR2JZN4_9EUKA
MSILPFKAVPKISTLSNGLRVATIPIQSDISTIGVWVKSGSIYENAKNNGVSHYLEHILFRGNDKFPQTKLEEIADLYGINITAQTTRTTTSFSAEISNKNLDIATKLISQMIFNPKIEESAVENERTTILTEENEVNHNYEEVIWDNFHLNAYPDSSVGFPILGSHNNIKLISAQMIRDHYNKFYNPSNCIFLCATKLEHERCCDIIQKETSFLKSRPPLNISQIDNSLKIKFNPMVRMYGSNYLEKSMLIVGLEAPAVNDPDLVSCRVVTSAIGNITSDNPMEASPILNMNLNNNQNALSSDLRNMDFKIFQHYQPYGKTGLMCMIGSTKIGEERVWLDLVIRSLISSTVNISNDNLKMAKLRLKYDYQKNLSSSISVANEVGANLLLTGYWEGIGEWMNKIEKTTKDDLVRFYTKYIENKMPAIVSITKPSPEQMQKQQQSSK